MKACQGCDHWEPDARSETGGQCRPGLFRKCEPWTGKPRLKVGDKPKGTHAWHDVVCVRCGRKVRRYSARAEYCGNTCRSRAYEERKHKHR